MVCVTINRIIHTLFWVFTGKKIKTNGGIWLNLCRWPQALCAFFYNCSLYVTISTERGFNYCQKEVCQPGHFGLLYPGNRRHKVNTGRWHCWWGGPWQIREKHELMVTMVLGRNLVLCKYYASLFLHESRVLNSKQPQIQLSKTKLMLTRIIYRYNGMFMLKQWPLRWRTGPQSITAMTSPWFSTLLPCGKLTTQRSLLNLSCFVVVLFSFRMTVIQLLPEEDAVDDFPLHVVCLHPTTTESAVIKKRDAALCNFLIGFPPWTTSCLIAGFH